MGVHGYVKSNEEVQELMKHVWKNKEDGTHAWKPVIEGYLTFEPVSLFDEDSVLVCLAEEVDSLGYPMSIIDTEAYYEWEIEEL